MKYIDKLFAELEKHPRHVYIYFLLGAGFLIRLTLVLKGYYSNVMSDFSDDLAYMNLAQNMIQQGLFVTDLQQLGIYSSIVGPAIGWLLYLPALIGGGDWLPVFIMVAAATSFIPVLVYLNGLEYFNYRTAVAASLWAMIYIAFYKNIASAGKDLWMTLGMLLFLWYYGRHLFNKPEIKVKKLVIAGAIYGFLILLDERFLVLSPVFFLFIILNSKRKSFANSTKQALVFTGIVILMLVPWTIRNYMVYERFILVSVRTAPITEKIFGLPHVEYFLIDDNAWYVSPEVLDSVQRGLKGPETQTGEYLGVQQVEAIRLGILPQKFSTAEFMFSNFIEFWQPLDIWYSYKQFGYRFDGKWSLGHNLSILVSYGILIPFMILGLIKLLRHEKGKGVFFCTIIFVYMIFHITMIPFTEYRYRMPLDGILILLAFYSLFSSYKNTEPGNNP